MPRTSDLTLVVTTRAKTFSSATRQEYDWTIWELLGARFASFKAVWGLLPSGKQRPDGE